MNIQRFMTNSIGSSSTFRLVSGVLFSAIKSIMARNKLDKLNDYDYPKSKAFSNETSKLISFSNRMIQQIGTCHGKGHMANISKCVRDMHFYQRCRLNVHTVINGIFFIFRSESFSHSHQLTNYNNDT